MKQIIRYLYEYENGVQIRNIGFVKMEKQAEQCIMHIHGKGLDFGNDKKLEVYVFYLQQEQCIGIRQGEFGEVAPVINYILKFDKNDMGGEEAFEKVAGIVIQNTVGRTYAAVWTDVPVDIEHMILTKLSDIEKEKQQQSLQEEQERSYQKVQEEVMQEEKEQQSLQEEQERLHQKVQEEVIQKEKEQQSLQQEQEEQERSYQQMQEKEQEKKVQEEVMQEKSGYVMQMEQKQYWNQKENQNENQNINLREREKPRHETLLEHVEKLVEKQEAQTFLEEEVERYIPPSSRTYEKIQRQDISRLPRREWKLANNSFLLHGFYNYHHLLFIEEDGNRWLGVPGIYHEKERAAARAFGFPQFHRIIDTELELSREEKNTYDDFGYWCRKV